ncbi:TerB family tellurite resistance protein [Ammoniphilus sp. CFH 90114]|uniref:TerB family tellurite resistance protein n=1 Tax=Ammoniphilus sp. CFH 90114 TaxID=2493665 RepID=UPI00100F1FB2|nr:TerB family tellurite resistance protein [Ammoniphilus sp. CFH 90114]RXT02773.1 TerB family tellurite resistance protein [Ammoniphilus sp. CFH 90114]
MFLNQLQEQEKKAFIELAHLVAMADGYLNEKERELIELYKHEMGISEEYALQDLPLDSILAQFETEASKNIAFIEVLGLIFADGGYNDEERKIVKTIKQGFGFTPEKYETCKAWVRRIQDVYAEGLSLIHG